MRQGLLPLVFLMAAVSASKESKTTEETGNSHPVPEEPMLLLQGRKFSVDLLGASVENIFPFPAYSTFRCTLYSATHVPFAFWGMPGGELTLHSTPLFIHEDENSGEGTGHDVWDGVR